MMCMFKSTHFSIPTYPWTTLWLWIYFSPLYQRVCKARNLKATLGCGRIAVICGGGCTITMQINGVTANVADCTFNYRSHFAYLRVLKLETGRKYQMRTPDYYYGKTLMTRLLHPGNTTVIYLPGIESLESIYILQPEYFLTQTKPYLLNYYWYW